MSEPPKYLAKCSKEELKAICSKGGKAAAQARQKNIQLREAFQSLLSGKYTVLDEETGKTKKVTGEELFALTAFQKSLDPNIRDQAKWWEMVRDTAGAKPTEKIEVSDTSIEINIDEDTVDTE